MKTKEIARVMINKRTNAELEQRNVDIYGDIIQK